MLGSPESDPMRRPDEEPVQRIMIEEAFAVGRYEVTVGELEAFVRATGRDIGGDCLTDRNVTGNWAHDAGTTFRDPGFSQTQSHPVACVSWDDAQAYADWLSVQTGRDYRLLTELEWEYVARADTSIGNLYPWGNDPASGCGYANAFDQSAMEKYGGMDTSGYTLFDPMRCRDGWLNTSPVGSLTANGFGVHDIIGNVSEWVGGCHTPSHDAQPAGESAPGAGACVRRVAKGGSWGTLAHNFRIGERLPYPATHRDDSIGIRVARSSLGNAGYSTSPIRAASQGDSISWRCSCWRLGPTVTAIR